MKRQEIKRIGTFGVVGVINTLLDFAILDFFHLTLGWAFIPANLISTTVAMIFSFFMNRHVVFKAHTERVWHQIIWFWIVTAFGLYVLQTGMIWLLEHPWLSLSNGFVSIERDLGFRHMSKAFLTTNTIKLLVDVVSMAWNYVLYKKVVFVSHQSKHTDEIVQS